MNKMSMTYNKDGSQVSAEFNSEFELSPQLEEIYKKLFSEFLQIEVLQGERTVLPDGMIRYRMNIDKDKQEIFRQAWNRIFLKDRIAPSN